MACFLVPAAEAAVVMAVNRTVRSREEKAASEAPALHAETAVPFSRKLRWLSNLLWGGSALLAFEHVWHGEVIPWFPFLTAAANPQDTAAMLHEMSTVGVAMALAVTAVWAGMVLVSNALERRGAPEETAQ